MTITITRHYIEEEGKAHYYIEFDNGVKYKTDPLEIMDVGPVKVRSHTRIDAAGHGRARHGDGELCDEAVVGRAAQLGPERVAGQVESVPVAVFHQQFFYKGVTLSHAHVVDGGGVISQSAHR